MDDDKKTVNRDNPVVKVVLLSLLGLFGYGIISSNSFHETKRKEYSVGDANILYIESGISNNPSRIKVNLYVEYSDGLVEKFEDDNFSEELEFFEVKSDSGVKSFYSDNSIDKIVLDKAKVKFDNYLFKIVELEKLKADSYIK